MVRLRRNAREWIELQRLPTNISGPCVPGIAVYNSRVLLGDNSGDGRLYVFDVNAEHSVSATSFLSLESLFGKLACTRRDSGDTDTLVAFSHNTSVSLQRLGSLRLEPFARVNITNSWNLLFRRK